MSQSGDQAQPPDEPFDNELRDENLNIDRDSALGSSIGEHDDLDSTASLSSSIMRYREENGRTYNGFGDRTYVLPNDELEKDRLDLQHHLLQLTFDGKLTACPIGKGKAHRVLDIGTGTGIWAIDYGEHPVPFGDIFSPVTCEAEEHPESQVLGIDVSPIQPTFIPPNLQFEIDDLEQPWAFTQKFDFIHSRMMTGSFGDWPRFIQQTFDNLNPGGYLEIQDVCFPIRSLDSSPLPPSSALFKWAKLMFDASVNLCCGTHVTQHASITLVP